MTVIVTGGTGLVGNALSHFKPEWIYLGSKDCNLLDKSQVENMLKKYEPKVIIHLAANVGGLFKNISKRLEMFNSNLIMNYNLLQSAYEFGVKRVICCLSTCIFPDGLNRVLKEEDLHKGEPHVSNYGYAYAKRVMEVQCRLYNESPGFFYQCIVPTNIYGPNDYFNLKDSHVIPALIHKMKLHDKTKPFQLIGSGMAKRQFIYSYDLAKIMIEIIEKPIFETILICSPPETEETTILNVAEIIGKHFGIVNIQTTTSENDGQIVKTASPNKLLSHVPNFTFTPLSKGLENTINWFLENYHILRK